MSRSNYAKPFYVDVGTSIVAVRCASNNDVVVRYDHVWHPHTLKLAEDVCDRMNKEVENRKPLRNCDIYTMEEQSKRHEEYCKSHSINGRCVKCPLWQMRLLGINCAIAWANLPYEKGEAK